MLGLKGESKRIMQNQTKTSPIIALVGLPNTGKTQLFNQLTKRYELVANYPLTTIVKTTAELKLAGKRFRVVDLPGCHSFFVTSEEEGYVRHELINLKPNILIQCIDAQRLKQSLLLTAELLELGLPLIVCLTAVDETQRRGKRLNSQRLARALGVPVVEYSSLTNTGLETLKQAILKVGLTRRAVYYPQPIEKALRQLVRILPGEMPFPFLFARLLLERDPSVWQNNRWLADAALKAQLTDMIQEISVKYRANINRTIAETMGNWADELAESILIHEGQERENRFQALAAVLRHPWWGLLILILVLTLFYFTVVWLAGFLEDLLATFCFDPLSAFIKDLIPEGLWQDFLLGEFGVLSLGLFNALGTILPILFSFFLIYGLLEDIGYLPNLAILLQRLLRKLGLSGRAMLPLVLGFGCKTMASLMAKTIPSRKEKLIALYLIAFAIPCSAQLGLVIATLGHYGLLSFFIYLAFIGLVEVLAGLVLNRLIKGEQRHDFIQELPTLRLPQIRALITKTLYRLWWFIREALPIFLIAAVVIFFLNYWGILDWLKGLARPLVNDWLGLPDQMVEALLLILARNELGAGQVLKIAQAGQLSWVQAIVAVSLITMFIPCLANVIAIIKEVGLRAGLLMLLAINITSIALAGFLRLGLSLFYGG